MMRSTILLAFLLAITGNVLAQSVVYVNDTLRVGVRAEPVSGAKTVSVVKTGEALEVLDNSNAAHYKVKTPAGRIGWVSRTYVSEEPPAFMRLEAAQQELESMRTELKLIEEQLSQMQEVNLSLEGELSQLATEKEELRSQLAELSGAALIPEEYQFTAWVIGVILLLYLGFLVGGQRVHNQVRNRFGGLDV